MTDRGHGAVNGDGPPSAGSRPGGWLESAWPDALAFAAGLALAWHGQWETKDLVWSLWLSSLLVGYAMIVWTIFGPAVRIGSGIAAEPGPHPAGTVPRLAVGGGLYLVGGLFMLAFFTVHFGGFHFVHSAFLSAFFPLDPAAPRAFPGPALYAQVLAAYWPFVLVTAVAERNAFRPAPAAPPDTSVKAADVNRRLARRGRGFDGMMAPYKNVVRMHLLIFFFAFASIVRLEGFLVYAVVSAVYFFPWRRLRR